MPGSLSLLWSQMVFANWFSYRCVLGHKTRRRRKAVASTRPTTNGPGFATTHEQYFVKIGMAFCQQTPRSDVFWFQWWSPRTCCPLKSNRLHYHTVLYKLKTVLSIPLRLYNVPCIIARKESRTCLYYSCTHCMYRHTAMRFKFLSPVFRLTLNRISSAFHALSLSLM